MTTHLTNEEALTTWHKRALTEERVPCGVCQTFQFWDKDGNLLRQDIKVLVEEGIFSQSDIGKVG